MKNKLKAVARIAVLVALPSLMYLVTTVLKAQQPHSVTLSWKASSTAAVTVYNIHRVAAAGGSTIGSNYATVTAPATTYKDTAVTAGQTYYYTVSAWCPTCAPSKESALSNEVVAVLQPDLPPTPEPPSELTGKIQ